jgi:hypothetical protein
MATALLVTSKPKCVDATPYDTSPQRCSQNFVFRKRSAGRRWATRKSSRPRDFEKQAYLPLRRSGSSRFDHEQLTRYQQVVGVSALDESKSAEGPEAVVGEDLEVLKTAS